MDTRGRADIPEVATSPQLAHVDTVVGKLRSGEAVNGTDLAELIESLARTAAHYELLVENMSDVVFHADLDRRVVWISPTIQTLCGYAPEALVGRPSSELVHADDVTALTTAAAEVEQGRRAQFECRIYAADAGEIWVAATLAPLYGPAGNVVGAIGSLRDIDEAHRSRAALVESEEHYRLLAQNSSDVVAHSRDGLMLWVSPAVTPVLGWQPEEWIGRRIDDYVFPEDLATVLAARAELLTGRRSVLRFRVQAKDESWRWIESHVHPYRNAAGATDGVEVSFRIVDSEVDAERELEWRATHDQLTGLISRNTAFQNIAASLRGGRTHRGDCCALLFCDLDRFKTINDEHGHIVGDKVLRTVAHRIERAVRSGDLVARVGGDEILVALNGVADLQEAADIAEQIRSVVREPLMLIDGTLTATLSIGVTLSSAGETVDATVNRADQAMYQAKHAGRDRVVALAP